MQGLIDAVSAFLDAGLFYNTAMYEAICKEFDFTEEELSREKGRVEHGALGMDIYYARRKGELFQYKAREAAARKRLPLSPGQRLGTIRFDGRTATLRNCFVIQAGELEVVIDGTAGNKRQRFSTTYLGAEQAIKNAVQQCTRLSATLI
jgi:hypothetical protein